MINLYYSVSLIILLCLIIYIIILRKKIKSFKSIDEKGSRYKYLASEGEKILAYSGDIYTGDCKYTYTYIDTSTGDIKTYIRDNSPLSSKEDLKIFKEVLSTWNRLNKDV